MKAHLQLLEQQAIERTEELVHFKLVNQELRDQLVDAD
jgi:hypothetical protein